MQKALTPIAAFFCPGLWVAPVAVKIHMGVWNLRLPTIWLPCIFPAWPLTIKPAQTAVFGPSDYTPFPRTALCFLILCLCSSPPPAPTHLSEPSPSPRAQYRYHQAEPCWSPPPQTELSSLTSLPWYLVNACVPHWMVHSLCIPHTAGLELWSWTHLPCTFATSASSRRFSAISLSLGKWG